MNNRQNVKDVKQDMENIINLYHNHVAERNGSILNNGEMIFVFSYKERALFFTFLSDILSVGIDRFSIHRGGIFDSFGKFYSYTFSINIYVKDIR